MSLLPTEPGALCVSIHDVAPETWSECEQLLQAVRAVADIPLTWLVVPHYHGSTLHSQDMEDTLAGMLARGHELALHGYTHLDDAPARAGPIERFRRAVYTEGEGEFAAIDLEDARRRIAFGIDWFRERGWPAEGFVAPAWLIGPAAWKALREFPFLYTTTFLRFHLLAPQRDVFAPSLVYAARNAAGRALSPPAAGALSCLLRSSPLIRLALHPRDARHPALLCHAQHLIERLLTSRVALTKAAFARAYQYQYGPQAPPKRQCERA